MKYANNFQSYAYEIGTMVAFSGRDINDLGRFGACNAEEHTRYISLAVHGLPIGIYFGVCGPKECTEEDYLPLSEQLATLAKAIQPLLPDGEALKVDWTADNFKFRDSKQRNAENTSVSVWFFIAVGYFSFFIIF